MIIINNRKRERERAKFEWAREKNKGKNKEKKRLQIPFGDPKPSQGHTPWLPFCIDNRDTETILEKRK